MSAGLSKNERAIAEAKFATARECGGVAQVAGRWGKLVIEAHDALAAPARAVVDDDAALWPEGTEYVLVKRELLDALRAALDV